MTEPLRDKLIERHYAERMAMLDQAMQAADVLASYRTQTGNESGKADLAKVGNAIWGK